MGWELLLYWTPMEMDKVIVEKKQLPSAVGLEMSILIKTFIFKYISLFICSDMCLLHANFQTAGLRKLEKGILIENTNSMINTKKCKERKSTSCFSFSLVHTLDCSSWAWPLLLKACGHPQRNLVSVGHGGGGHASPLRWGLLSVWVPLYFIGRGSLPVFLDLSQKRATKSANSRFKILLTSIFPWVLFWVWMTKAEETYPKLYNYLLSLPLLLFSALQSTCQISVDFPGKPVMTSMWPKETLK